MRTVDYTLHESVDLSPLLEQGGIQSLCGGPAGELHILVAGSGPGGGPEDSVRMHDAAAVDYAVYTLDDASLAWNQAGRAAEWGIFPLPAQTCRYRQVQPLGKEQWLLAASRHGAGGRGESHARVFDAGGQLLREFPLGEGLRDMQVTSKGHIWAGYAVEGLDGQGHWPDSFGTAGLLAWDGYGSLMYANNNYDIADCLAINVAGEEEVWFYYDADHWLVRWTPQGTNAYQPQMSGSDGFAVYDRFVLFRGGNGSRHEYKLMMMGQDGSLRPLVTLKLRNREWDAIASDCFACRSGMMWISQQGRLYRLAVERVVRDIVLG